jgi:hypothetical protein
MASTINGTSTGNGGLISTGDDSGILNIQTNETTAITVDASQNVGIGTTTPKVRLAGKVLSINGTDSGASYQASIELLVNGASSGEMWANSNDFVIGSFSTQPMIFRTQNTERMRIDSSGNLGIGTTTTTYIGATFKQAISGGQYMSVMNTTLSAADMIDFVTSSGFAGKISVSGTTTTYSTSSDYRLKENIAPMVGALNKVAQLKPVTYKWKATGEATNGFIAHELAEIIPECVVGEKDELDADGNPKYQGIDTSFLVATLTAAMQELKAINDTQAETINALTARIVALEGA